MHDLVAAGEHCALHYTPGADPHHIGCLGISLVEFTQIHQIAIIILEVQGRATSQDLEQTLYVMRLDVGTVIERLETSSKAGPSALSQHTGGAPKQIAYDPEILLRILSHR